MCGAGFRSGTAQLYIQFVDEKRNGRHFPFLPLHGRFLLVHPERGEIPPLLESRDLPCAGGSQAERHASQPSSGLPRQGLWGWHRVIPSIVRPIRPHHAHVRQIFRHPTHPLLTGHMRGMDHAVLRLKEWCPSFSPRIRGGWIMDDQAHSVVFGVAPSAAPVDHAVREMRPGNGPLPAGMIPPARRAAGGTVFSSPPELAREPFPGCPIKWQVVPNTAHSPCRIEIRVTWCIFPERPTAFALSP